MLGAREVNDKSGNEKEVLISVNNNSLFYKNFDDNTLCIICIIFNSVRGSFNFI